jgi:hypothetical protein
MKVKKEYRTRTRNYLKKLYEDLNSIDLLKLEIEDLKRMDKYKELDVSKILGFKSHNEYKDISDLRTYISDQIDIKEGKIKHILSKYDQLNIHLRIFKDTDRKIIEYRFFKRKKGNEEYTLDDIAILTGFSLPAVKRKEKKMIEEIAVFKYKTSAIEENEPKVS